MKLRLPGANFIEITRDELGDLRLDIIHEAARPYPAVMAALDALDAPKPDNFVLLRG